MKLYLTYKKKESFICPSLQLLPFWLPLWLLILYFILFYFCIWSGYTWCWKWPMARCFTSLLELWIFVSNYLIKKREHYCQESCGLFGTSWCFLCRCLGFKYSLPLCINHKSKKRAQLFVKSILVPLPLILTYLGLFPPKKHQYQYGICFLVHNRHGDTSILENLGHIQHRYLN